MDVVAFPETGEGSLFKNNNYQVSVSISISSSRVRQIICVFDTDTGPNLIETDVLYPGWLDSIRQRDRSNIRSASYANLDVSGTITTYLLMGESRTFVNFGVVNELVVPVLFGTIYIDSSIKSIHPAERKVVPHHSPTVPILIVYEANSKPEKNNIEARQEVEEELTLLETPIKCEPKCITVARQVVLKAMCETLVIVSTQAAGLTESIPCAYVAKHHACMMAKGLIDAYPGRPCYITFVNSRMAYTHLLKH